MDKDSASKDKKVKFYQKKSFWSTDVMVILLMLVGGFLVYSGLNPDATEFVERGVCEEKRVNGIMRSQQMRGVIESGETYDVRLHYYDCNEVGINDIVAFEISNDAGWIVKTVKGLPGQEVELVENKGFGAWSIKVDGEYVLQSDGAPVYFGRYPLKSPLGLYLKRHNNRLAANHHLVFSAVSPGINDSGILGVVDRQQILGKVEVN